MLLKLHTPQPPLRVCRHADGEGAAPSPELGAAAPRCSQHTELEHLQSRHASVYLSDRDIAGGACQGGPPRPRPAHFSPYSHVPRSASLYPSKGEQEEELRSKSPFYAIVLGAFVLLYVFPSGKRRCLKTIARFHLALVLITGPGTTLCAILIPLLRSPCIACSVYRAAALFLMDIIITRTSFICFGS